MGLLVCLPLAALLGQFFGIRIKSHTAEEISNFVPTTILGLLALLLGFTFSMSVARYDSRQQLALQEANAIGTAYLRTDMLPQPYSASLKAIFSKYIDVRLKVLNAGIDPEANNQIAKETQELQKQLWQTSIAAKEGRENPLTALYFVALNEVIDLSSTWDFSLMNRVPDLVYIIILIVTFVGIFALGYINGYGGIHSKFGMIMLSLLFATIITLVKDLDRPRRGLIRISQANLISLQKQIQESPGK